MSVTTKLEVEYSQFKKGMAEAQASVKTLDAELKLSEAQFKANGDAEKYFTEQAELLTQKLNQQKKAAEQAEQMLLSLGRRGVQPTSVEYQKMAQKMLNAQAAVASTQAELNTLNQKQTAAAGSAKDLAGAVSGIGKNVSLQNITDGLSKITGGMEKAYRTAVRLGKTVVRSAMDATGWADDVMTRAMQYGTDVETIQKMDMVAAYIDTDVDTIISAKDKLSKNRDSLAELLGISSDGRNVDDVFWEAGEAIMNLGEGFDQNEIAMKIFGKGWRELLPLFTAGREEYESLMENQNVLSTEQVKALAEADDAFKSIQHEVENLKRTFWADNAGTIVELLQWVVDNKDAVVAALVAIGAAFAAMKVGEFALELTKVINGFREMGVLGGAGAAAKAAGAAAGGASAASTAGAAGTTLVAGTGAAEAISSFLTSPKGLIGVATLLGVPVISKAVSGELFKNPDDYLPKDLRNIDTGNYRPTVKDLWKSLTGGEKAEVPVEAKVEDGEAEKIAGEIGTVTVPATLDWRPGYQQGYQQQAPGWGGHANGMPWVPRDGYLAVLHRGERIMTAAQNRNYTYNSHNYFGNVNLNNGMQIEALTDSIDRRNRRQRAAYGE